MAFLEIFANLAPFVQLALVVGSFATILLIAYNRTAATNLVAFLYDLYEIRHHKRHRKQQGLYHQHLRSQPLPPRRSRVSGKGHGVTVNRMAGFSSSLETKQDAILKIGKQEDMVE